MICSALEILPFTAGSTGAFAFAIGLWFLHPWDKRVARLWCTLFRNREERNAPGAFLTADARGNLRRIHDQFQTDHGLQLRHGTEPEMMWLKKDENGQPAGGYSNPYCYHIDQFESLRPVYMRVIEYCRKMGLDMIQGDHEDAPGQLELNFNFDIAEKTADNLSTYRQVCKQVGREMQAFPCFMPKPFMGVSANGCHHNISLWEGDTNKFMPAPDEDQRMPGQIGKWAIGGILGWVASLGIRLGTADGQELAGRAATYIYIPVCVLAALALTRLVNSPPVRRWDSTVSCHSMTVRAAPS